MDFEKELIAERIKSIRKEKRLSMEKFAELIGASGKSTVNEWEKARSIPSDEFLDKISEIGKVSKDFILFGSLEDYVQRVLFKELEEHDTFFNSVKDYAYLTTNLSDFESAPFIYDENGKLIPPDEMDGVISNVLESELERIINENLPEIMIKIDNDSLSYRDDSAIASVATSFFYEETLAHSFSFEGSYHLLRKALNENPLPLTMGDFSDEKAIETLKKNGYSDSKILETQFEARLDELKTKFSIDIAKLYDEYIDSKEKLSE